MPAPRTLRILAATVVATLLATLIGACSSAPPKPEVDFKADFDFSKVHKIGFFDKSGEVIGPNPLQLSDMQKNRADEALRLAITAKGFTWVDDPKDADLLLSWYLVTEEKTDVRTYETPAMGVGYGRYAGYNRYSLYNCWGCTQTEVSVRNYTQGTFIVDMISPELDQSVWRSVVQSRLKGEPGQDQDKYNAAATRILAAFPPGSAPAN